MWMLFARAPPPDAPYWPGRRWLAVIDALFWPSAAFVALSRVADDSGLVLAVALAVLVVSAARRVCTALLANHRYHFTTWRWFRVPAWMAAIGALLKFGLAG